MLFKMKSNLGMVGAQSARWTLAAIYLFLSLLKLPQILATRPTTPLPLWLYTWVSSFEFCLALWFLSGWDRMSFWTSLAFSLLLAGGYLFLSLGGIDLSSCGCFGALKPQLQTHFLVLAMLGGVSLYGLLLSPKGKASQGRMRTS
jgi:hypothetical protein